MEGLNQWTGMGNLGADPELRVSPGGTAVLKLRLACSDTFLDRNNARQERTEWVSVTVFGKRAEALGKILYKGDRLGVTGRLSTSSYEKDGEKRYRTEVIADKVLLNGRGRDSEPEERREAKPPRAVPAREREPERARAVGGGAGPASFDDDAADFGPGGDFGGDDDIPFIHQRGLGWGRP